MDLSVQDLVLLGAEDNEFFCRTFFPNTARQASPAFHLLVWDLLDNPLARYCNVQIFRDGAKTSLLRMFAAKRVAYAISHTILYIGKSEGAAIRSTSWLRRAVEYNSRYSQTFNLRPGDKWQDVEFEIYNGTDEVPIWVMAAGIEGTVRGLNRDDFRPDLIILDDVLDEENSATPESRDKLVKRIHGAVKPSLAPASEAPNATLAMLQTPVHKEDASTLALKDPDFHSLQISCWTDETQDLPIDQQVSAWEERYPSEVRRREKKNAIAANRTSTWNKEMECRITSPETSDLRAGWLNYYDLAPERRLLDVVVGVDPVPPPSDIQIAKGMQNKDYEVFAVWGKFASPEGDRYYMLELAASRGHQPDWSINTAFRLYRRWRPRKFIVEGTAYQRTLKWIFEQEMSRTKTFFMIDTKDGTGFFQRRKRERIVDAFQTNGSKGRIFVPADASDFADQWEEYPDCAHDDLLDASATAVADLEEDSILEGEWEVVEEEDEIKRLADHSAHYAHSP